MYVTDSPNPINLSAHFNKYLKYARLQSSFISSYYKRAGKYLVAASNLQARLPLQRRVRAQSLHILVTNERFGEIRIG
jgi:hypothetical protein